MSNTITPKVVFKNANGSPTIISEKDGEQFSARGDYITGKNLVVISNKIIVQN